MLPGMGGMGGMNPRQMQQMMKRLGIETEDLEDVQSIVIKTPTKDYVFTDASVSVMKAQGSETYTITGTPEVQHHEVALAFSDEDVKMVMDQCGVDEAAARAALEEHGDLAEAVMALMEAED